METFVALVFVSRPSVRYSIEPATQQIHREKRHKSGRQAGTTDTVRTYCAFFVSPTQDHIQFLFSPRSPRALHFIFFLSFFSPSDTCLFFFPFIVCETKKTFHLFLCVCGHVLVRLNAMNELNVLPNTTNIQQQNASIRHCSQSPLPSPSLPSVARLRNQIQHHHPSFAHKL